MSPKLILIAAILFGPILVSAQPENGRIAEIRQVYSETNRRISEAESHFSESEIFLTELIVNSGETMYPAVGQYRETIKFYYTYGDREVSPYPNRLIKIAVFLQRSAERETAEYYFDAAGRLVFALESEKGSEKRFYFASGKLIRWQKGTGVMASSTRAAASAGHKVSKRAKRLTSIFVLSISGD